jgi:hypothetical protein
MFCLTAKSALNDTFGNKSAAKGDMSQTSYRSLLICSSTLDSHVLYSATPAAALLREKSGMMISTKGEVAWQMPEGHAPYWRGRLTEAEYEFEK